MANDLGTIGIALEVKGREALRQIEQDLTSVDRTAKNAAKSFEVFDRVGLKSAETFKYMGQQTKDWLSGENRRLQMMEESRRMAEREAEAQRKVAQARAETAFALGMQKANEEARRAAETQAELLRLEAMYNKVSVAARVYEQAQESLNKAVALGVISADQQEAKLAELSVAYQKIGSDANNAQAFINRFGENAQVSGRGLNQFGMYAQQVGYQVGDFLVQVQSGTNFMVAFGQQATQLAGLIPGVLGAALGIGISLFTAIGAAIMRTSESSKTLQDSLTSLEGNVSSLNELVGSITVENYSNMIAKYGELNQAVYDNIGVITQLNAQLISLAQIDLGSLFSESFGGILTNRIDEMRIAFETTNDQARVLLMMMDAVGEARGPDQLVQAMTALRDQLIDTAGGVNNLTTRQAEFVLEISNAIDKATIAKGKLEQMGGAAPDGTWMNPAIGGVDALITRIEAALGRVNALKTNLKVTAAAAGNGGVPELPGVKPLTGGEATVNIEKFTKALSGATGGSKALTKELTAAEKAAKEFSDTMDGYVVSAVGGVADAFGDFITRGFKDFKGFVKDVIGSFKNMIAQMIAIALKNKILIGLGFAGAGAGGAGAIMGSGFGTSGLGGMIGTAASGFGSGFMSSVTGGFGGMTGAIGGGLSAGGIGGVATAIGAIAAPLLAVAGIFSFFKKKTKELDSGLRITVGNMDALVETFKTVQTTRFFGLSKKTTTTVGEAGAEISDPIVKAVQDIQTQVLKAAEMFGIAESEFADFVYKFDVSLKGLTDEQKIQKVNEELLKMGDAFTALSGQFTTMNELLAAAQQRYDLQTRLLELQGDTEALLTRQRELELATVHDLNLALLQQIHTLEDQKKLEAERLEIERRALLAAEEAARVLAEAERQALAIAKEKTSVELKLLEAQGKATEALKLKREQELAALDETNRAILQQVFDLEDLAMAQQAANEAAKEAAKIAEERTSVEIKMLELQNKAAEALRIQREKEIAAVDESNRALLRLTFALEDYNQAVANTASATDDLRSAMDRQLSAAQSAMDAARSQLEKAVERRVETIQKGFAKIFERIEAQIDSAKAKAESSRRIFELLDNALSGRSAVSEAGAFASRRAAMTYVSSGGMDVDKLTSALGILNEPSEQFFGTFQDYARDFALTTNAIEKSRAVAEVSMTADEKAVALLERQLEQARASEARQIAAVEKLLANNEEVLTVQEALAKYLAAQATYEQVQAQHQELIAQFPMLKETFLSVADAVRALSSAIAAQTAAQTAVANAIASAANVSTGNVPGFAVGGMHIGGPRIVGENGPELEVTGPSRIYSNRDTANMFRDPELASAVDGLRREVSGMRSEQLQIQVETSKNVKRIYDIERKWDTDGLPPERV